MNGFIRYSSPEAAAGFGPSVEMCADGTYVTLNLLEDCTLNGGSGFPNTPLLLFLQGAAPDGPAVDATGASDITNDEFAFFVQDKWQVTPQLILSLGLRWEAQMMPGTIDPTTTAFGAFLNDPQTNVLGQGFPSDGTIPDQTDMIQPRIGLAYDVTGDGKTVVRASWGVYNARQNMLTQVGAVTTNGVQQQTIAGGAFANPAVLPTWPLLAPVPPCPGGFCPGGFAPFTGVRIFSKDYENPRIYTGNVAFEHEFTQDWVVYVDGTISNGTRLPRFIDVNRADRGGIYTDTGQTAVPWLGEVMVATSIGQSTYNGVTFGMRKRFSEGYQLEWNYTWSEDMDDDSNERDPFTDRSLDPSDLSRDFAFSDRDIRNKFNLVGTYELPNDIRLMSRIQSRSAQPCPGNPRAIGATVRNDQRKDNEFFSLDWRIERPFHFGSEKYSVVPVFEMFNSFNNDNNIIQDVNTCSASAPGLFNFDGFLRQGVGDPMQIQLAVKVVF